MGSVLNGEMVNGKMVFTNELGKAVTVDKLQIASDTDFTCFGKENPEDGTVKGYCVQKNKSLSNEPKIDYTQNSNQQI
jgi:hypothetical protein